MNSIVQSGRPRPGARSGSAFAVAMSRIRRSPWNSAVTRRWPSGANATAWTGPLKSDRVLTGRPEAESQIRTVRSLPADARSVPSRLTAMPGMPPRWPVSVIFSSVTQGVQRRTASPFEAMRKRPSGLNVTAPFARGQSSMATSRLTATSQSRRAPSFSAGMARTWSSGLNATPEGMSPRKKSSALELAGVEQGDPLRAGTGEPTPSRAEGDAEDQLQVGSDRALDPVRGEVPDQGSMPVGSAIAGRQSFAVGTHRQAGELLASRDREAARRGSFREVPEGDGRRQGRADGQRLSVRRHRDRDRSADAVAGERPVRRDRPGPAPGVAILRLPDRDGTDRIGGDQPTALGCEEDVGNRRIAAREPGALGAVRQRADRDRAVAQAHRHEGGIRAGGDRRDDDALGEVRPDSRIRPREIAHAGHGLAAELVQVAANARPNGGPA